MKLIIFVITLLALLINGVSYFKGKSFLLFHAVSQKFKWQNSYGLTFLLLFPSLLLGIVLGFLDNSFLTVWVSIILQAAIVLACLAELRRNLGEPSGVPSVAAYESVWQANRRYVAPFFWFGLLGAPGLLFYTLAVVFAHGPVVVWREAALKTAMILEWMPARMLGFAYGLVGKFSAAMTVWLDLLPAAASYNHQFIVQTATKALGISEGLDAEMAAKAYQELTRNALIVLAGGFAALALLSWLF